MIELLVYLDKLACLMYGKENGGRRTNFKL